MPEITFGDGADADDEPPKRGGRPRQHTGSSIEDIFNREDTKNEIKFGTTFFALVGLGLGLGVVLADIFAAGVFEWGSLRAGITLAPLLAVYMSQRQSTALSDAPDNIVYGTAAVTAIAGTLVLGLVLWLFGEIAFDFVDDLGDLVLAVIGIGLGAAAVGVGMSWVMRNVIEDWN